jgi:hypothetical protein
MSALLPSGVELVVDKTNRESGSKGDDSDVNRDTQHARELSDDTPT